MKKEFEKMTDADLLTWAKEHAGDDISAYNLQELFENVELTETDKEKAFKMFRTAAKSGRRFGFCILENEGVIEENEELPQGVEFYTF